MAVIPVHSGFRAGALGSKVVALPGSVGATCSADAREPEPSVQAHPLVGYVAVRLEGVIQEWSVRR